MARRAAAYPDKRVLLAGDAAHVHHPVSGGGLNTKFGLSYKETAGQVPVPLHDTPRLSFQSWRRQGTPPVDSPT